MSYSLAPAPRDYKEEDSKHCPKCGPGVEVQEHPFDDKSLAELAAANQPKSKKLLAALTGDEVVGSTSSPSKSSSTSSDPLSGGDPLGAGEEVDVDPLSAGADDPLLGGGGSMVVKPVSAPTSSIPQQDKYFDGMSRSEWEGDFEPWGHKKAGILQKYTTNERIGISVNFMEDDAPKPTVGVDKTKERLEELEDADNADKIMQLSQKDYIAKIEGMHDELLAAWNQNQRVKALKIAIQCAKLLSDVTVIKFYPSKFVLISEILDTFGKLVFDRLRGRSVVYDSITSVPKILAEDFKAEDVTHIARETCRNWFFKIASIRELLPRLYVELAILSSYRFLSDSSYPVILQRLKSMLRGIGDPLVASYARAYLARKGRECAPLVRDYLLHAFFDHVQTELSLSGDNRLTAIASANNMEMCEYMDLYTPAVEWILQCVAHRAEEKVLRAVLAKYKEVNNAILLNNILTSFEPNFIAVNAVPFTQFIRDTDHTLYPLYKLYRTLGMNLVMSAPPKDQRMAILNDVWKVVTKLQDPNEYIAVAEVFIEYPVKHCTPKEVNTLLGDILKHVQKDHAYESLQEHLQSITSKILSHYTDILTIFGMSKFLPILDLFRGEAQVQVHKAVLQCFARNPCKSTDPVIINAMFEVGKTVHDSINALSFADDIRQISTNISQFIRHVDYGMDLEKQLQFYVDCRRAFANLDSVKTMLVVCATELAMRTHKTVNGQHTKRTAAFVRACIAYCFITIPAMDEVFPRLYLYLLAGQVAMVNTCIPQAEAMFKAAVLLLQETPTTLEIDNQVRSTDPYIETYVASLSSMLLTLPGHPEHGAFYLVKALIQVLDTHEFDKGSISGSKLNIKLMAMLCAMSQKVLPYHVPGVEANDVFYAGDPDYQEELQGLLDQLFGQVMTRLTQLKEDTDASAKRNQAELAIELFNYVVAHCKLDADAITVAAGLFDLAKKCGAKRSYLNNCISFLRRSSKPGAHDLFQRVQ